MLRTGSGAARKAFSELNRRKTTTKNCRISCFYHFHHRQAIPKSPSHSKDPLQRAASFSMNIPSSNHSNGENHSSTFIPPLDKTVPSNLNDAKPDDGTATNPAREAKKREKELKKQESIAKAEAKKQAATIKFDGIGATPKDKVKKELAVKKEKEKIEEQPFVNTTPYGEKKGDLSLHGLKA